MFHNYKRINGVNRCIFAASCWKMNEDPELSVKCECILNVFLHIPTKSLGVCLKMCWNEGEMPVHAVRLATLSVREWLCAFALLLHQTMTCSITHCHS